jgi:hypothetical protein
MSALARKVREKVKCNQVLELLGQQNLKGPMLTDLRKQVKRHRHLEMEDSRSLVQKVHTSLVSRRLQARLNPKKQGIIHRVRHGEASSMESD